MLNYFYMQQMVIKGGATLVSLGFVVTFFGLVLRGVIDLFHVITVSDTVFAVSFIAIGSVFVFISAQQLWKIWQSGWTERATQTVYNRRKYYFALGALFVLMFILRVEINSILAFIGLNIGVFLVQTARVTYLTSYGVDLAVIGFGWFAWVFQWYVLDMVLQSIARIGKRCAQKLHANL